MSKELKMKSSKENKNSIMEGKTIRIQYIFNIMSRIYLNFPYNRQEEEENTC